MENPFAEIHQNQVKILETLQNLAKEKQTTLPVEVPMTERFLDSKEARALLGGISSVSLWTWEKNGIIKSYRLGHLKRYRLSELLTSPKLIKHSQS